MILSLAIELIFAFIILGLFLLLFFFMRKAKKKRASLVSDGKFITEYFNKNENIRREEYVPYKNKPINQRATTIFMAKTFCLVLVGTKTKRINYDDIYWVYGITPKNTGKKSKKYDEEGIAICYLKGKVNIFLRKQEPYVKLFYSLNIPAGYGPKTKVRAMSYKKELKKNNHEKGNSPKIQFIH